MQPVKAELERRAASHDTLRYLFKCHAFSRILFQQLSEQGAQLLQAAMEEVRARVNMH